MDKIFYSILAADFCNEDDAEGNAYENTEFPVN